MITDVILDENYGLFDEECAKARACAEDRSVKRIEVESVS